MGEKWERERERREAAGDVGKPIRKSKEGSFKGKRVKKQKLYSEKNPYVFQIRQVFATL